MSINGKKIIYRFIPYLIILTFVTILISPQLIGHATFITADRFFHFGRFYDSLQQIKTGNYNYFQTNYSFGQCGRIINAVYGPYFAYLNGLLLWACGSWFKYEIVVDYILFLVAGMGMFRLTQKVKTPYWIGLLLSLLYLSVGILPGWLRANNFMAWGSALAPYVIMIGIEMVQNKEKPFSTIKLMLIMSLLAQIHLLSTVILAFALIPFAIIGFKNIPNKKLMIRDLALAVGGTLLLTANIWGALLEVSIHNQMALPKAFNLSSTAMRLSSHNSEHSHVLKVLAILLVLQLIYAIWHVKKNKMNFLLTVWGAFFLIISSKLMPWDSIQTILPVLGRSFQFPYRLMVAGYPLLFAGMGITVQELSNLNIKQKSNLIVQVLIYLGLGLTLFKAGQSTFKTNQKFTRIYNDPNQVVAMTSYYKMTSDPTKFWQATNSTDLGKLFILINKAEADYLPDYGKPSASFETRKAYEEHVLKKKNSYIHYVKNGNLYLKWYAKKTNKRYLPLILYSESSLILNGQELKKTKVSNVGTPLIQEEKGWNIARLSFKCPESFKLCIIVSLVSWILMLFYGIRMWIKRYVKKDI